MSNRRRPAVPPGRRSAASPRPAARPAAGRASRPATGRAGRPATDPVRPGSPRARLAGRSRRALTFLTALPRWVPALATAVLLLAGLAVPGPVGAACLLVVGAFLGWLVTLSWPLLRGPARLLRVLTVALVVGFAVYQFTR